LDIVYDFPVGDLALMLVTVTRASRDLGTGDNLKNSKISTSLSKKGLKLREVCTDEWIGQLAITLDGLSITCRHFDPDPSLAELIIRLRDDLLHGSSDRREAVLKARLDAILGGIENNLNSRKFMFMPADQALRWQNTFQFGEKKLLERFGHRAVSEMLEAGNCYAAGRWTACVFHSIRVSEYALRKLAKKVGAKISDKGKPIPLEYGSWGKVISQIKNRLVGVDRLPLGPRKERKLKLYSDLADHCDFMKNIWRNESSHTRRLYEKPDALRLMARVRSLLQLLTAPLTKQDSVS